jgi:2,5-diketo-D-gluconate reductase A
MAGQPTVPLNSGTAIPQLGFGVFQVPNDQTTAAVTSAFEAGYRSIDTAAMYRNEEGVGKAIVQSGIPRDDLFITTKLNNNAHGRDAALRAFDNSLEQLGLEYVDLYLIHWPLPALGRYVETWQAFETLYRDGRTRAIGVSNFHPTHLRRLLNETDTVPALNQIELHPYIVQEELRTFHAQHGIATEAGRRSRAAESCCATR